MTSLGEQLRELREQAGMGIEELSNRTKIPPRYLRYLEREEYEKLPPPVYIRGFLQRWAKATGGDPDKLSQQFYRENKFLVNTSQGRIPKAISRPRFVLTFKHIVSALAVVGLLSLLGYVYYNQFISANAPRIEIVQPLEVSSVSEERVVLIEGNTRAVDTLFINGQEIPVVDGSFSHEYELAEGLNTVSIVASGGGQQIEVIRNIIYTPNEPNES